MLKDTSYANQMLPISDKYGVYAMGVGQDITIRNKTSTQMSSVVEHFKRRYDRQYVIRKIEGGGCRIWRTK